MAAVARRRKRIRPQTLPQFVTDPDSDRGATGLAMLVRPCALEKAATGSTAIGREQTDRLRYSDCHLIDRMFRSAQLSDRQHEAATKLLEMWTDASITPAMVASYGERTGIREPPTDEQTETPTAADIYRRLVRPFKGRAPLTPHKLEIVETCMMGRHPGVRWLATAQSAFDDLADFWKIPRG